MAVRVHHVVVFKTKVLHFKTENTPIKDKWEEKVQWNAQFPFCGLTKAFRYEIGCLSKNSTLFCSKRRIVAPGLF